MSILHNSLEQTTCNSKKSRLILFSSLLFISSSIICYIGYNIFQRRMNELDNRYYPISRLLKMKKQGIEMNKI